jgi:hypothetical protein
MSDTKEPSDMPSKPPFPLYILFLLVLATLFLLVLAAVFIAVKFAVKLLQKLKKTTNAPDTKEPPCMTELLARAAKYLPRPNKCSANQQQQNACEQILYTHRAANGHRRLHSAESDVEVVVCRTL